MRSLQVRIDSSRVATERTSVRGVAQLNAAVETNAPIHCINARLFISSAFRVVLMELTSGLTGTRAHSSRILVQPVVMPFVGLVYPVLSGHQLPRVLIGYSLGYI